MANSIELGNRNDETGRGDGGYIDFHYEGSTLDYTSRIIENNYGVLNLMSPNGLLVNGDSLSDFVVQNGVSGMWTYRKWKNGVAECWGRTSLAGSTTMSELQISLPFTFSSSDYIVTVSPSINGTIVSRYLVGTSAGNDGRTTTSFKIAHQTSTASYSVSYMINVIGRWK